MSERTLGEENFKRTEHPDKLVLVRGTSSDLMLNLAYFVYRRIYGFDVIVVDEPPLQEAPKDRLKVK